ncbi:MAG: TolC family protein [bacterium]
MTHQPVPFTRRALRGLAIAAALVAGARGARAQDTARVRPPSRTITLQQAIAIALQENNTLRLVRNNIVLDSLAVRQARNAFLPNLSVSSQASQRVLSGNQGQNTLGMNGSLSSGVTLFNGGQNRNILRQAQQNQQAGGFDLGRARQGVVFTVASDYLNLITQQEQLRVQQENLTAQEEELRQLQEFVNRGTRPIGDLYNQQAAVASTRLALVNARRASENAKVDLIQELVLDPRVEWVFETPTTSGPAAPQSFRLDSLLDLALAQRVDLQAQRYRVRAAETEVAIAKGGRLPVVTGSAGFGSGFSTSGDQGFFNQLDASRGGSIGVGVSVPIFDRGAVSIARQRAQVQLENELLTLRDVAQSVAIQIRRAYLDYVAAEEQLVAATAQQEASALALRAAQSRYNVGSSTFIEVTLARAQLIQAQSAVVNARSALVFQQALMSYYTGVLDPATVRLDR